MQFMEEILLKLGMETNNLGSTDAAPGVPQPHPTQRDEATRRGRCCPRVWPHPAASCRMDPTWFSPTHADAASTRADSPGIELTWA